MDYEKAVRLWGSIMLPEPVDVDTVRVEMEAWIDGYCETCEYAASGIAISGRTPEGRFVNTTIETVDFANIVKEIAEIGLHNDAQGSL